MPSFRLAAALSLLLLPWAYCARPECACDVAKLETLQSRQCSLCKLAEAQPPGTTYFFIKDSSPSKPHRWLALPRFHGEGLQTLAGMTAEQRAGYWTAAIGKARELWGDAWGLAMNGVDARSQCHAHIHIGKLLDGVENGRFVVVDSPAQIPVPEGGTGIWVHPEGGKLHAHLGDMETETVLQR